MLVFQPEFEAAFDEEQLSSEIIILLDCSNSMAGSALLQAKQIALHALKLLSSRQNVNVIKFGTSEFLCFFPNCKPPFTCHDSILCASLLSNQLNTLRLGTCSVMHFYPDILVVKLKLVFPSVDKY